MVVLGKGYVGKVLLAANPDWIGTQRQNPKQAHYFNANEPLSWDYQADSVLITFSLAEVEEEHWEAFQKYVLLSFQKVFLLASTSRYNVVEANENSALVSSKRVAREEQMRFMGARIFVLSGIYGPGRCPLQWLKKGLISQTKKDVNLIHVEDIEKLVSALVKILAPQKSVIFWDGRAMLWQEVEEFAKTHSLLPLSFVRPIKEVKRGGKILQNNCLLSYSPKIEFVSWREHLRREYSF